MVISLDDFYMDTEQTPLNRKGKPDFESIYALDIERINRCIKELIEQGRTNIRSLISTSASDWRGWSGRLWRARTMWSSSRGCMA